MAAWATSEHRAGHPSSSAMKLPITDAGIVLPGDQGQARADPAPRCPSAARRAPPPALMEAGKMETHSSAATRLTTEEIWGAF